MNRKYKFRISIKYKFSLFLSFLLVAVVGFVDYFVLSSITSFQAAEQENALLSQLDKANLYITQMYLSTDMSRPLEKYVKEQGNEETYSVSNLCGMNTAIFDTIGGETAFNFSKEILPSNIFQNLIEYAKKGKKSYAAYGDYIYFTAPLQILSEKPGIILFEYSIKSNLDFYNKTKNKLFIISLVVLFISLIVGNVYYQGFVSLILKLKKQIEMIGNSNYDILAIEKNDEIGDLSFGIQNMGKKIQQNIENIITEKDNLALALEKLQVLEKKQNLFIGSISHEFKTPLTSIIAYSDLMEMYENDQDILLEARQNIKKEGGRLLQMVERVLMLQSIQKYSFEFHAEKIDLEELINDVLNRIQWKADKHQISIRSTLVPAFVFLDKDSLIQILLNLVDNAIKYNPKGGIVIVESSTKEGKVQVFIKDSGIGIPKESREKIFEPFYTVNTDRDKTVGGTGLGLSIVKQLVQNQQGRIELFQSGPKGTIFLVEFPLSD